MKPSVSCILVIIYFIEHSIERILTAPHSVCIVSAEKAIKQLHGLQKAHSVSVSFESDLCYKLRNI